MNTNKPDIAQIQKYLNGELDDKAMHALEQEAQNDPFLMDALEGYQTIGRNQQDNLAAVKERFAQRVALTRTQNSLWRRVLPLAAILLLALAAGLLFLRPNKPPVQARQKLAVVTPSEMQPAGTQVNAPVKKASESGRLSQARPGHIARFHASAAPDAALNRSMAKAAAAKASGLNKRAAGALPVEQLLEGRVSGLDITRAYPGPDSVKHVSGIITNAAGHALAGVKIGLRGAKLSTVTDSAGKFTLTAPAAATLNIAYGGYDTRQVALNGKDSIRVVLNESASQLAEISVPGYVDDEAGSKAHPAMGWKAFTDYIRKNAFMPDGETGRVKLAFKVAADGKLKSIRVIRGKSDAMNQKAIALLMNGPDWSSPNDTRELKLKIRFRKLKST